MKLEQAPTKSKAGEQFIEEASRLVAESPVESGDPAANALLQETRDHIYHWPSDFPGFETDIELVRGQESRALHLTARSSRDYEFVTLDGEPCEVDKASLYHLEELLAHREAPSKSRMHSTSGVVFGPAHPIYGPRVDFVGDRMSSFYHLKEKRITGIGRGYKGMKFVIYIDDHVEFGGRFCASHYHAHFSNAETGAWQHSEYYLDRFLEVDGILLPRERRMTKVTMEGSETLALLFANPTLLNQVIQ